MTTGDRRLAEALRRQLELRDAALARGARQVGWKLGTGDRERIDSRIVVGHLTSETVLGGSDRYASDSTAELHVDAEAAVELRSDVTPGEPVAIAAFDGALEVVDLAELEGEPDGIVAANIFHRGAVVARFGDVELAVGIEIPA